MKMKKILLQVVVGALVLAICSCNSTPKSSMDEATEQALVKVYGEPFVVNLSEPGTLSKALDGEDFRKIIFLRVFGPMNGDDIAFLNESDLQYNVKVLDLLDAHLVAGGKVYCDIFSDMDCQMKEDNVVGSHSFYHLMVLEQLFLPQDVTAINESGINSLSQLRYVRLPKPLKVIGSGAFSSCSELSEIELPEGLTEMGESAFYGCKKLKSLRIPKSVTTIGGGEFGEFEHLYISWTPEEFAKIKEQEDFNYIKFDENAPKGVTRFSMLKPALHVPASMVEAYKEQFRTYRIEADTEAATEKGAVVEKAAKEESKPATLNTSLLGMWSNNTDPNILMVVSDKFGDHDGRKGYGYVAAANEYYEYDFILVITSVTPDGDNIKVHYDKMESYCEGDPDDYDSEDAGEWVEKKVGEGDLTLIPQAGGKVKIDSKEKRIKNKVLSKTK